MLPSDRVSQYSDDGVLSARLEAHDAESGRDNKTLLLVIRSGDTLKGRQTGKSFLSTGRLLVEHSTDSAPHHKRRRLEMEGSSAGVGVHALPAELGILDAVASYCKKRETKKEESVKSSAPTIIINPQDYRDNSCEALHPTAIIPAAGCVASSEVFQIASLPERTNRYKIS